MARINFDKIFQIHPDGSIEPKSLVKIGGVQFGPGVRFGKGIAFSGIVIADYLGRDFEVQEEGGITVIKGVY